MIIRILNFTQVCNVCSTVVLNGDTVNKLKLINCLQLINKYEISEIICMCVIVEYGQETMIHAIFSWGGLRTIEKYVYRLNKMLKYLLCTTDKMQSEQ